MGSRLKAAETTLIFEEGMGSSHERITNVATLATAAPGLNALPLTVRNERLLNGRKGD